jgi:hypothetical protein
MKSGYHQIPMKTDAIAKTAFVTPDGLYHFKRVSFALANAPSDFQRLINVVFGSLRYDTALAYIDDRIVPSDTLEEGLKKLNG